MGHQDNLNNLINKYKSINDEEDNLNSVDSQENDKEDIEDILNNALEDINNKPIVLTDEEKREIHKLKLKIRRYQRTFKNIPDIQTYNLDQMDLNQLRYTISEIQLTVQNYNINEMGKQMVYNGVEVAELGLNIFDIDCTGTSQILKNNPEFNNTLDEVLCEYDISYFPAYKRLLLSIIFAFRTQYKLNKNNKLKKPTTNKIMDKINKLEISKDKLNKYSSL
jgi:hypothetical protein